MGYRSSGEDTFSVRRPSISIRLVSPIEENNQPPLSLNTQISRRMNFFRDGELTIVRHGINVFPGPDVLSILVCPECGRRCPEIEPGELSQDTQNVLTRTFNCPCKCTFTIRGLSGSQQRIDRLVDDNLHIVDEVRSDYTHDSIDAVRLRHEQNETQARERVHQREREERLAIEDNSPILIGTTNNVTIVRSVLRIGSPIISEENNSVISIESNELKAKRWKFWKITNRE